MIREQILRAATTHFVRYGMKRVKMDHIAQQLHISKKTIYDHFSSKNQLFDTCVKALIEQDTMSIRSIAEAEDSAMTALFDINSLILNNVCSFGPYFIRDLKEYNEDLRKMNEDYRTFVEQVYTGLLHRGMEEGLFVPETDCLLIPKLFDALMELIFSQVQQQDERQTKLYRFTVFTLLTGFCTEYGRKELTAFFSEDIVNK